MWSPWVTYTTRLTLSVSCREISGMILDTDSDVVVVIAVMPSPDCQILVTIDSIHITTSLLVFAIAKDPRPRLFPLNMHPCHHGPVPLILFGTTHGLYLSRQRRDGLVMVGQKAQSATLCLSNTCCRLSGVTKRVALYFQ